jgi:RimJ/RimL family protein N-acetyltransferase
VDARHKAGHDEPLIRQLPPPYRRDIHAAMKSLLDEFGEIHTTRLTLRVLRLDDTGPLFALFSNWNVIRLLSSPPWPYLLTDAQGFVRGSVEHAPGFEEELLAITHDGIFIGAIGVRMRQANALQRGPGPNIGYWLGEQSWGQGFMTEAVAAFVRLLFNMVDCDAIYCGAFAQNTASLRVQEKNGFVHNSTSTLFSTPRGADFPHVNTALTRERFKALTA